MTHASVTEIEREVLMNWTSHLFLDERYRVAHQALQDKGLIRCITTPVEVGSSQACFLTDLGKQILEQ